MRRIIRQTLWIILPALMAALLSGCFAREEITFVSESNTYSVEGLTALGSAVGKPSFAGDPVADAVELRQTALTALRRDPATTALADLLTDTFPPEVRSVPYYAELAKVDNRDAWIVIEVWGPSEGRLDNSRIWAFDKDTGDVIVSTVF
ncbi:MAG: hypothetical protein KJ747_10235 [Actinobacteria bacterium]|nr:hypothetical protein [Actinomycetota bacterium]MDP2232014.1 hypothetical protein [Actinomycetota bacterium]